MGSIQCMVTKAIEPSPYYLWYSNVSGPTTVFTLTYLMICHANSDN